MPSQLFKLSDRERAFVYASIQLRCESEKKSLSKIKK
nr:MAG TPA: hypothetical protein [Caudoviricetes sp.]